MRSSSTMSSNFYPGPEYSGLQPAIPFERPSRPTSTRSRTETPIHPPRVPTTRSQQQQQSSYQTQLQHPGLQQQQQHQNVQQIAQQARQQIQQTPNQQQQEQQWGSQGDIPPQQQFHRITPGQKPRTRQQIIIDTAQLDAAESPHDNDSAPPQQHLAHQAARGGRHHVELEREQLEEELQRVTEYERLQMEGTRAAAEAAANKPPRKKRRKTSQPAPAQGQGTATGTGTGATQQQAITIQDDGDGEGNEDEDHDLTMLQEAESGGDHANGDDNDNDNDSLPEEEGPWIAPLVQPITPLKLPTVRPTLLLGPYDTREDCHQAAQDYAIKQGYVLVSLGCYKAKGPEYPSEAEAPIVRQDLKCDRGGICKNAGKGLRRRKTHRLGCPARIKLVRRKRYADKWFIDIVCEEHNHDLDPNHMELNAAYRRYMRVQQGKARRETDADRAARLRRPKEVIENPEPVIHQIGVTPAAGLGGGVGGLGGGVSEAPTGPLHLAAMKGQYRILEILLDNGGELNGKDAYGRTPLHCAVEGQKMDCVTLLVDRGADVRLLNNRGVSALHLAVEKGMEDAVVMFIEKGADPNRLAFYLTPDILSLCDELKRQRQLTAPRRGRPRRTT